MTKIMIVDDEDDLREMISIMLHKEGFETELAKDGADFLKKIDDFEPDIVTLDVMMPGLTTKEILEKLKEKITKPKIILLTVVRYSEEEKQRLYEMGIADCITKPFEIDQLVNTVNKYVIKQESAI